MAGVTDVAFRVLARKYGASLTYTEFASSAAIVRDVTKTFEMIKVDKSEKPVGVQLFGGSPDEIVTAAKKVESKFDIIDINCGCPVWKVVRTGAGSKLMDEPKKIKLLVEKLVKKISKPITVKLRTGADKKHINVVKVAKLVEKAGASAVAVHGRTAKQGYSGEADWKIIKKVKDSVNIPVIGNGDVFSAEDFKLRLEESGVDAIMIGRGAIGNPYLFTQINEYMQNGSYSELSKNEQFFEYLKLAKKFKIDFKKIKGHAMKFSRGIEGGAKIRVKVDKVKSLNELKKLF
jgi:nifR3 family TIM-barrel protein